MPDSNCEECTRLKEEYRKATLEFFRLDDELIMCTPEPEEFGVAKLKVQEAERRCRETSGALANHQATTGHL